MTATPLARILAERIRQGGPIPLSEFMAQALGHPEHGYYTTRDPFGARGDFTTAPEISQMFGELIGLWCAVVWQMMGSPARVVLAELGPGRGTLMADLLRAARTVPAFAAALDIRLVETSPALRARQRQTLAGIDATWAERVEDLPDGPLLLVANEFFDALPVRQFVKAGGRWHERMVGLEGDRFAFVTGPEALPDLPAAVLDDAPEGAVAEVNEEARRIARIIGRRIDRQGGAALIVDYGHGRSALGDTVQAVKGHAYHPVLDNPGAADLTAHVDFESIAAAAIPARAWGPRSQGDFLRRLGIESRAAMLAQAAGPEATARLVSEMHRLIDPAEMGTLFKVLALAHPAFPPLPGLEP